MYRLRIVRSTLPGRLHQHGAVAGSHKRRDPKLTGHGGHVPRDAADVGDEGPDPAHKRHIARRGLAGDHHNPFGDVMQGVIGLNDVGID